MVIKNLPNYQPKDKSKSEGQNESHGNFRLANPIDRLAAIVVDLILISLASSLLFAPYKKSLLVAQLTDDLQAHLVSVFAIVLIFIVVFILYNTFFVFFSGRTPGKTAFRLRVVDIWNKKNPSFYHSFTRSLLSLLEAAMFCYPFLAVFSDKQRRSIHDRLSDSIVLTDRANSYPPEKSEVFFVKFFSLGFLLLFLSLLLKGGYEIYSDEEFWAYLDSQRGVSTGCEIVSESQEYWPAENGKMPERTSVALGLYAASLIDAECLDREADLAFRSEENKSLAYLARAFAISDIDGPLSDEYLEKTCESNEVSEECKLGQVIKFWSEKDWTSATDYFTEINEKSRLYFSIWAIQHFERVKDFRTEMKIIERLSPDPILGEFLGKKRAKALWGLHRYDAARAVASTTIENSTYSDRMELSAWFCFQELESECNQNSSICKLFKNTLESDNSLLGDEFFAITDLKYNECKGELDSEDIDQIEYHNQNEKLDTYLLARRLLLENKKEEARDVLQRMEENQLVDDIVSKRNSDSSLEVESEVVIRYEVKKLLLSLSLEKEEVENLEKSWRIESPMDWEWRLLGKHIIKRYAELEFNKEAVALGEELLKKDPFDYQLRESMVVLAFSKGFKSLAWKMLKELPESNSKRSIASENKIDSIKSQLRREFGGVH